MPFSVASVTPYNPPYQSVFHIWDDYLHLSGCSVFGMSRAEVVVYMAFLAVLMPFSVDHDYIESESVVFPEGKVPKMLPERSLFT